MVTPGRPVTRSGSLLVAAALSASALAVTGPGVRAQAAPSDSAPAGMIRGIAYDSLRARPLVGAVVQLEPGLVALTDGSGAFRFDSLPAGDYRPLLAHDSVPSWTLAPAVQVSIGAADTTAIRLTTLSRATLRQRHCRTDAEPFSVVVRDLLTGAPLPGAEVVIRGEDDERRVRTTAGGEVVGCVTPRGASVTARLGSLTSREREASYAPDAFTQVALYLQATSPSVVRGRVIDAGTGQPVDGVLVGVSRARAVTDGSGTFVLTGIAPGNVRLFAEHIAYGRAEGEFLVNVGDTVDVRVEVQSEAVELAPLRVEVRASALGDRITAGTRYDGLSRAEIDAVLPRTTSMTDLLRHARVPGLHVEDVYYMDDDLVPVPGVCIELGRRRSSVDRLCRSMVDVYVNGVRLANPEMTFGMLDPTSVTDVRILSPLEAGVQYGGGMRARNGVVLIRTR